MRRLSPLFGPVGTIGVVYLADMALAVPLLLGFRVALPPPRGRAWWPILWAGFLETAGSVCITLGVRRAPVAIVVAVRQPGGGVHRALRLGDPA